MCFFDFGGLVNKVVYVIGMFLLGQGNFYFMVGVFVVCIILLLVIVLVIIFFLKGFSEEECVVGMVNYIFGCIYIIEGVIFFVVKDFLCVILMMMIVFSIFVVFSYSLCIQVLVFYGGFLILFLVSQLLVWVLYIFVGFVCGVVMFGLWRLWVVCKNLVNIIFVVKVGGQNVVL